MCDFFSAIVTRDHRVLFTEEDSHETIIARAGLTDILLHGRPWVRVELRPDGPEGWQPILVDERTTPGWWDPVTDGDRVRVVADRVRAAWATYDAAVEAAMATYGAAVGPAAATYVAAVEAVAATYDAARAPTWAIYAAAYVAAMATYDAAAKAAWATYDAARAAATATYVAARAAATATYVTGIRTMDGYVPALSS